MKKAFTLIELALVLIIIGVLLGGGFSLFALLTKREKVKEAESIVKENTLIIKNYATINKKLPNSSEFKSLVKTSEDIWGKPLLYKYATNLTDDNSVCYENTTPITVKICKDSGCNEVEETISNVAFLILSCGENLNCQTGLGTNTIRVYIPGISVDNNSSDVNRKEAYDDIIRWVKLEELKSSSDCKEYKVHILNNELPYGYVTQSYKAKIFAEGGKKFYNNGDYKWCYEGSLPPGLNSSPKYNSSDCLANINKWKKADYLQIEGTPTTEGSYKITVYVSDRNNNIDKRSFVITINP
jgi:prepilin-type N-terminal cleavage/methylation domain-containing protein